MGENLVVGLIPIIPAILALFMLPCPKDRGAKASSSSSDEVGMKACGNKLPVVIVLVLFCDIAPLSTGMEETDEVEGSLCVEVVLIGIPRARSETVGVFIPLVLPPYPPPDGLMLWSPTASLSSCDSIPGIIPCCCCC
jgi:hypothetical protein